MGWAHGDLADGREVGYAVPTTCEQEGCEAAIDRGLAYLCGEMHGQDDQHGCGRYFCGEHLFYAEPECVTHAVCGTCLDAHGDQPCDEAD